MPSGFKSLVFNPRERAISTDVNQLQKFVQADVATLLRAACNTRYPFFYDQPGIAVQNATVGTPLRGEVFEGLMVDPTNATYLLVEAGTMLVINPDSPADPNDNPYHMVWDPGVTTPGQLAFVANSSPSLLRLDVVECQPVDIVEDTDSRDIFNPVSGLFTTATVNKVRRGRLIYRIRQGTAGAGLPANAAGWLPLAVVVHAVSSASFANCTVYDVRPLLADRANLFNVGREFPITSRTSYRMDIDTSAGQTRLSGVFDREGQHSDVFNVNTDVQANTPYWCAGKFRKSTPGADDAFIDLSAVANQSPGVTLGTDKFHPVVVAYPGGLPRWVRYSAAPISGKRRPWGPRGIVFLASSNNVLAGGIASTKATMPASMGLTVTEAVQVVAMARTGAGGTLLNGQCAPDGWLSYSEPLTVGAPSSVSAGSTLWQGLFQPDLLHGLFGSGPAAAIQVVFGARFDISPGVAILTIEYYRPTTSDVQAYLVEAQLTAAQLLPAGDYQGTWTGRISLENAAHVLPESSTPAGGNSLRVRISHDSSVAITGTPFMKVLGWKLRT